MPAVGAASATGGLLLGQKHAAFRGSFGGSFDRREVRRTDLVIVMNLRKQRALHQWHQYIGKQQVGNFAQLVTGCGMTVDLDAQRAQLLNESPDLRAADADLVGNLGAADHYRGVIHQQADNAAQARVGLLCRHAGTQPASTSWDRFRDVVDYNGTSVCGTPDARAPCRGTRAAIGRFLSATFALL